METTTTRRSAFSPDLQAKAWPYQYAAQIEIGMLIGGIPSDPNVAEGWLRKKLAEDDDALIAELVAQTMAERGLSADDAIKEVDMLKHLNGFKRGEEDGPHAGELYIEGRQIKAAIKEAASVSMAADKIESGGWGKTNKGLKAFIAEHVFVEQDRIYTGRFKADGINQRFVHTFRGSGIQYEEYLNDITLDFTVRTDFKFQKKDKAQTDEEFWAIVWLTGEPQGIGSSRSQGYGRFVMTRWDEIT